MTDATAEGNASTGPQNTSVLFSGSTQWDLLGRKIVGKAVLERGGSDRGRLVLGPELVPNLEGKGVIKIVTGPVASHTLAITANGKVYGLGRNDYGNLGIANLRSRHAYTLIPNLQDHFVVEAALGRNHTILLTKDGVALALGDNRCGQLGIGTVAKDKLLLSKPTKVNLDNLSPGTKPVRVSCGADFSVLVADDGAVYTFGLTEFGQCGHGVDGKYFVTGTQLGFHNELFPRKIESLAASKVYIVDVACGANSTIALDKEGKVWTWGHGGHGRTGHNNSPNDEMRPRCLEKLENNTKAVYAGATAHYVVTKDKRPTTKMFGQTKKTGDSVLYPKPVLDLVGMNVHSISCGPSSTIVAADDCVVTWGPSPCFGELGYGDKCPQKSSTKPKYVDACENLHAIQVGMGQAFSIILVRNETDEDRKIIGNLPVLEVDEKDEAEEDVAVDEDTEMTGKEKPKTNVSKPKIKVAPRKRKAAAPAVKAQSAKATKPAASTGPSARSQRAAARK
jgi:alpha-tubulin suppressor-like RCC1 family protein